VALDKELAERLEQLQKKKRKHKKKEAKEHKKLQERINLNMNIDASDILDVEQQEKLFDKPPDHLLDKVISSEGDIVLEDPEQKRKKKIITNEKRSTTTSIPTT